MTTPSTPVPALAWRPVVRMVALAIAVLAVALIGWQRWATHWRPDSAAWPMQGIAVGPANDPISWPTLAQQNVQFAYIDATRGTRVMNPRFTREHDAAQALNIRTGAIHHYALCAPVGEQTAAFVRLVPREASALPPLIMIDIDAQCTRTPTRALVLAELSTFLTQIETHIGKAAVIAPSSAFEAEYDVASAINRPLMVESVRSEPDADGPAWALWLANDWLSVAGSTGPTRWLVLNDRGNGQ